MVMMLLKVVGVEINGRFWQIHPYVAQPPRATVRRSNIWSKAHVLASTKGKSRVMTRLFVSPYVVVIWR
jgi:hypothetical protein